MTRDEIVDVIEKALEQEFGGEYRPFHVTSAGPVVVVTDYSKEFTITVSVSDDRS